MNREETVVTDATTGGQKASKLAQAHLAPHDAIVELLEHYGKGEQKYPSDEFGTPNYSRGFKWSLSYDAMLRHAMLWWQGEEDDPETGSHHLAAVAWHALGLLHFVRNQKGTDDRWQHLSEPESEGYKADGYEAAKEIVRIDSPELKQELERWSTRVRDQVRDQEQLVRQ